MNKRHFLKTVGGASIGLTLASVKHLFAGRAGILPSDLAQDEAFWAGIRARFRLKPDYINLENGYYCLQPQEVLEAFLGKVREINSEASYYMRTRQDEDKLAVRQRLSALAGATIKK